MNPSRNFRFRDWCRAKGFTPKYGYDLIAAGKLRTFTIGKMRYISEEEDQRFDAATRNEAPVQPLPHRPERNRR